MAYRGEYKSASYERYAAHNEQSTVHKLKETYWTTKQAVMKKLGKKEDEHIVASDAELDSKLEVFRAIQKSSMELLRVIENYQDRLCALSQEENSSGRFLKAHSQSDKTRAGKIMAAVGKSLSFSSQQRLSLRVPLVRLYQEVETFRYRAISDTLMTINRMEGARTEYRGALLWMKDQSSNLDPDTYKQLEKFRKIQAQVKKTKARFDRLKLDTMQKIDLLAASRCNMFSHVLANYQSTLLHFWSKTSRTMSTVADSFKGYQYYEFNMLKELCEPSKKLAEETSSNRRPAERDTDATESDGLYEDDEGQTESEGDETESSAKPEAGRKTPPTLKKIQRSALEKDAKQEIPERNDNKTSTETGDLLGLDSKSAKSQKDDAVNLLELSSNTGNADLKPIAADGERSVEKGQGENKQATQAVSSPFDHIKELDQLRQGKGLGEMERLINWEDSEATARRRESGGASGGSLNNLIDAIDREMADPAAGDRSLFGDEEQSYEELKKKQDEELDFTGKIQERREREKKERQKRGQNTGAVDFLTEELELEEEKDDMALLNAIFDAPSTGEDDFTKEWQAMCGATPLSGAGAQYTPGETDQPPSAADFLPSHLLASRLGGAGGAQPAQTNQQKQPAAPQPQAGAAGAQKAKPKKGQKQDMSAWFNLFADLDPLSNPDAIGKSEGEMDGAL